MSLLGRGVSIPRGRPQREENLRPPFPALLAQRSGKKGLGSHGNLHGQTGRPLRRLGLGRRLRQRSRKSSRHSQPGRTLNTTRIKEILAARGLRPLRQLGQNFLAEPALATIIAHALPKSLHEPVQEIGPGLGALTRALMMIGHSVEAFELDQGLIHWLREEFQNEPRFRLIEGDALKTLSQHPARSLVCGNLPYSISTPLLVQLALRPIPPQTIVVTLQKEVADRYAA
ncbi:MAG: hypothetical protein EB056_03575, partial [Verrucomicrobia bacterium]|nr:hypothetical protein [Verrucomicrobiota bacterium]